MGNLGRIYKVSLILNTSNDFVFVAAKDVTALLLLQKTDNLLNIEVDTEKDSVDYANDGIVNFPFKEMLNYLCKSYGERGWDSNW